MYVFIKVQIKMTLPGPVAVNKKFPYIVSVVHASYVCTVQLKCYKKIFKNATQKTVHNYTVYCKQCIVSRTLQG